MRCILCEEISFNIICKKCQNDFLESSFYKRELANGFYIYSFYNFEEIKELINTKYLFFGDKVFTILAKKALYKFAQNFTYNNTVYAIPIDDHTRHQFSQTAILAKSLKSKYIKPVYNTLTATNVVKYAGKDLNFRQNNKRNFKYTGKQKIQVILIDDIVTSGTTILEARKVLEQNNCEVLFALSLCDVGVISN